MFSRLDYEAREAATLATYAAKAANSRGRVHPEAEHPFRTAYQRDRDRIVHTRAFRRLEYKTQVFVTHEGDYYRTRLTHTMEVSQIARTIARNLSLNEDMAEAIALAHDLGHTPFGHSGEEALRELMRDHGGFEHNLHSLRILDILEERYPDFPGLNLTYEVREGIALHSNRPRPAEVQKNFSHPQPLLEAQLVDEADSLCYSSHDVDDSIEEGLLRAEDFDSVALWRLANKKARETYAQLSPRQATIQSVRFLIDFMSRDLIEHSTQRLKESGVVTPADVNAFPDRLICSSPELQGMKQELISFLYKRVYSHHRILRVTRKAQRFLRELFIAFMADPDLLPTEAQERLPQDGRPRAVCDYVAGLTDRGAQDEYWRLFGPFEGR